MQKRRRYIPRPERRNFEYDNYLPRTKEVAVAMQQEDDMYEKGCNRIEEAIEDDTCDRLPTVGIVRVRVEASKVEPEQPKTLNQIIDHLTRYEWAEILELFRGNEDFYKIGFMKIVNVHRAASMYEEKHFPGLANKLGLFISKDEPISKFKYMRADEYLRVS